jgi:ribosomal protein S19E (S16A)
MKFKPAPVRVKQPELSDREKVALRTIANGSIVESLLCQRLKTLGLVAQTQAGWRLTPQGEIRLMFQGAR